MRAALLALGCAFVLGGCASDKLTLVENEDGNETGAVAIIDEKTGADKAVIDTKLTETKLTNRPKSRAVKQLKPVYTELFSRLPPKAERFTILFGFEETRIPPAQLGTIDKIRDSLLSHPGAQIEVVGFTDTTGPDKVNETYSKDRALAVVGELRELGFSVDPEDAVGRGELGARANGDPDEYPNELFRKVEVIVR